MSTDAELIYNACLRAERRLDQMADALPPGSPERIGHLAANLAVVALREEIGNGISREYPR